MAWADLTAEIAAEFSEYSADLAAEAEKKTVEQRYRDRQRMAEGKRLDTAWKRRLGRQNKAKRRAEIRCCGGAQMHFHFWRRKP